MTDKKYIASYLVDTGASKQNIQEVQDALVKSGDAGVRSASLITQGLEGIDGNSEKALGKIANGAQVSDAALKQLAARFVLVEEGVTKAYGSIEAAPQQIQDALKIAEAQVLAVNTAVVSMGDRVIEASERFRTLAEAGRNATKDVEDGAVGASAAVETLGTAGEAATAGVAGGAATAAESLDTVSTAAGAAAGSVEEMAAASSRAALPLPDVKRGFVSIAEAAQNMADSVDRGWSRDEEGGRESARALVEVLQNRLRLKEAIIDEFGAMEDADVETRAAYEAWDAEVQRLTIHVQEMVAVQRQAAVATKEGGEQFATLGLLAEQAGRHFGETGEKIGGAAGQIGLMAAMTAHLQRSFEGLKLNELEGGFARTAIQVAAVAATAAVAVEVGLKMAEADDQNAESVKNLVNELERWASIDLAANLRASDAELQVLLSDMIAAAIGAKDFFVAFNTGDFDGAAKAVDKIRSSFKGYKEEVEAATDASNRRAEATHKAATADEIAAKFAQENAEMNKRVAAAMDVARSSVEKRTGSQEHLVTAVKATAQADADAAREAAEEAEQVAKIAEANAKAKEVEAKNARQVVEALKESAKSHDDDSEKTKLDIENSTKAAKAKETEATAAKLAAEGLKEAAAQAKEDAKASEDAAKASDHLTDMLQSLTDAVNLETGAYAKKESAINKEIDKLKEELKTNKDLSESDKQRIEEMISVASHIDEAEKQEKNLTEAKKKHKNANDELTSSEHRRSDASRSYGEELQKEIDRTGSLYIAQRNLAQSESQIIVVKSGREAQIKADIQLEADYLNSLNKHTSATNENAQATAKNTESQSEAGKAASESSVHWDEASRTMTNAKASADGLSKSQIDAALAAARAGQGFDSTADKIGAAKESFAGLAHDTDDAGASLARLSGGLGEASEKAHPLVVNVHAIGEGLQDFAKSHHIIQQTVAELKKLEDQALLTAKAIKKASEAGLEEEGHE